MTDSLEPIRNDFAGLIPFWGRSRGYATPSEIEGWTLPLIVEARASSDPDSTLYMVMDQNGVYRKFTWHDMRAAVSELAVTLRRIGLKRGDRVAILGETQPKWIVADIAVQAVGGISVGIYPTSSVEEVASAIASTGASMILVTSIPELSLAMASTAGSDDIPVLYCGDSGTVLPTGVIDLRPEMARSCLELEVDRSGFRHMIDECDGTKPARIFFTSGSTGQSKGAVYSAFRLLLATDGAVIRNPSLRRDPQRLLAFLPLSHVSPAINITLLPLITDAVPYFALSADDLTAYVRGVRPTYLALMPRQYQKLATDVLSRVDRLGILKRWLYRVAWAFSKRAIERRWDGKSVSVWLRIARAAAVRWAFRPLLGAAGLSSVTRAQTTSAAMPESVAKLWAIWGVDLREGYGLTETVGSIAAQLEPFPKPGVVGQTPPQPWYELRLAQDGEVLFRSPFLFLGYWQDDEATREVLSDGWLRTGDLGQLSPTGHLTLVGRKKEVLITSGGKSLLPQTIEGPLRGSPCVSEVVAIGDGRRYIAALVELGEEFVADQIQRFGAGATFADVASDPDVRSLIAAEVDRTNDQLSRVAQIKVFRLVPRPFDIARGELTATRKVRRTTVCANFAELIDDMYDDGEQNLIDAQLKK